MLTTEGCCLRQGRFREELESEDIDAVLISDRRDIYYLTSLLLPPEYPGFIVLYTDKDS